MAGLAIRPVTAADVEALLVLWREVFPEYADPQRSQRDPRANIERKLAFGDGLFWLAESDGQLAGSAMAGYDGHRGWLYSVGVHPARRQQGIGRALVRHAEQALVAQGCPKVNLQVLHVKDSEQTFWRALGYLEDSVMSLGKRLGARL
jgi:ribosomal protein S18 acetylase RimI-like enzyme